MKFFVKKHDWEWFQLMKLQKRKVSIQISTFDDPYLLEGEVEIEVNEVLR